MSLSVKVLKRTEMSFYDCSSSNGPLYNRRQGCNDAILDAQGEMRIAIFYSALTAGRLKCCPYRSPIALLRSASKAFVLRAFCYTGIPWYRKGSWILARWIG